eukprot:CAMPEP_0176493334 /NCGR_PEP_ID=MMETSP0200_2-20121128/9495_1 /TAXON_ID=947934 /ORGANISM="Chaetoceros sp., Strain GSL56" /LENGTH=300 /DNA_ID=CAMNT_0017890993 /DNA_START=86 /DNA_END=988 /DNA_ORIENTATION=-
MSVLFCNLIRNKKWTSVVEYLGLFPNEAKQQTKHTFVCGTKITCIPIHIACMHSPTLQVIAAFIAASPKSLESTDGIGRTALHNAIRYKASPEVITLLISAAPRAVFIKAADGSLPLHLACLYSGPVDLPVIRYLLLLHPGAVEIPDGHGLLPKDLVCDNVVHLRVKTEIVEWLTVTEQQENQGRGRQNQSMGCNTSIVGQTEHRLLDDENMHLLQSCLHLIEQNDLDKKDEVLAVVEIKQCVVCMEREVSRLLVPCGHPALCSTCSTTMHMLKMKWRCPECRGDVKDVVPFFGRVLMEG